VMINPRGSLRTNRNALVVLRATISMKYKPGSGHMAC